MLRYLCLSCVVAVLSTAEQDGEQVALLQTRPVPADTPIESMSDHPNITFLEGSEPSRRCGSDFEVYQNYEENNWGTNYDGWDQCKGREQSPVTIWTSQVEDRKGHSLRWRYPKTRVSVVNDGHAIKVKPLKGWMRIDGKKYYAEKLVFKTPSEHKVDLWSAKVEMQIFHKSKGCGKKGKSGKGKVAMISILFEIGEENECLNKVLKNLPKAGCQKRRRPFDLGCFCDILDDDYWRYTGSLTTPPCKEGVTWNIMQKKATMSHKQWNALSSLFPGNNRHVQPLNDRCIESVCVP